MRRLAFSLCLLVLAACDQTRANTQIIASIDADPGVRDRAETLRVIVYGPPYDERGLPITLVRDTPFDLSTFEWPIIIALAPEGRDATRRYRVEAIARDAAEQPVATVRAISGYVPDQTLTLPLRLLDRCIGVTCEDPGQTCFGPDDCRDATIDPSALVDGGAGDMDGGAETCVEATCDDGFGCTLDVCRSDGVCEHVARDSMCDDENVCTDDVCSGSGVDGCSYIPNTVACDDGEYCNGIDVCAAGECAHPGNPCSLPTVCNESMGACVGCTLDEHCPDDDETFGLCTYADAICGQSGTQSRTMISYACETGGLCAETRSEDAVSCGARSTDGELCDDGSGCSSMDRCSGGACVGGSCGDAGVDAGLDAGRDAGPDASFDGARDAGRDSGPEAGVDSGLTSMELEGGVGVP